MKINQNSIIGFLLAMIFVMSVGFSIFTTQLKIGGMASVTSKWDVHIKSITAGTPVGSAKVKETPTIGADKLSASFSTSLSLPKDSLTYTVVVENSGNLDAKLNDIIFTPGESKAISYSYEGINKNEVLKADATKSFTITVSYNDVNKDPNPIDKTNNLTMVLLYIQA